MFKSLLFATLLFSGCNTIHDTLPKNYVGNIAIIHDTSRIVNNSQASFFEIYKINGKMIKTSSAKTYSINYGGGTSMNPVTIQHSIPAKTSSLSIRGITYYPAIISSIGGDSNNIKGDITISLEKNENYFVKGYLSNNYQAVWIEDSQKNIISEKISKGTKPKINSTYLLKEGSAQKSIVKLYNIVGGIDKFFGLDIYITIDGKDYGTIEPKEYIEVELSPGKHIMKLAHWDIFKFSSEHTLDITKNRTFIGVAPTGLTHYLSIQEDMPNDYLKRD